MKIDAVHIRDFRGIHELELKTGGKSVVLFGVNGVGKTTILAAVNLLYANIINRIVKQRFKQTVSLGVSDIRNQKAFAEIAASFSFGVADKSFCYGRKITHDNQKQQNQKELDELVSYFERKYIGEVRIDADNNIHRENPDFNLPIFVNYGVNRLVLKTPLRIRKSGAFDQYSAYERAIENQIAFGRLFEWFLEQEMYESLMQKQQKDYQDKSLRAVKKAMLAMLDGCRDIHIVAKPYSMRILKENDTLDILQLSDGEKCTLALFGDIARRLALANPSLDNPLEGTGVVLIDEIELHMHTVWQRKVLGVLRATFPNIQFMITTHSPQVLGEAGEEFHIISLMREGEIVSASLLTSLFGLDSNTVLEDIMKTDSMDREMKAQVDRMYDCLEKKDYDGAETLADLIDEVTKNRNADTVRARIMIKKGRKRNA